MADLATTTYKKRNSFESTRILNKRTNIKSQLSRSLQILNSEENFYHKNFSNFDSILKEVKQSLNNQFLIKDSNLLGATTKFMISELVAEEMYLLPDLKIPLFLFHRYRYEIYPDNKILDNSPPYVQIEPSSICNYRCKFCYQTDKTFSFAKSEHMGTMNLDTYKKVIDMLEGNTEFLSLASRGEPFLCKDLPKMLNYSSEKFMNLKINTNASLLNEERIHSLLSGGAKTIVFSIDAPSKNLYEELRVNGKIENVLKKLKLFKKIRDEFYPNDQVIVRVSGVYLDERQNMNGMVDTWGQFVDQITFVKYNPWENVYESPISNINKHCSDLWRRLFIWFDGKLNPCDTDYKSTLSLGSLNDFENINELWRSEKYEYYRNIHSNGERCKLTPCDKCVVI